MPYPLILQMCTIPGAGVQVAVAGGQPRQSKEASGETDQGKQFISVSCVGFFFEKKM